LRAPIYFDYMATTPIDSRVIEVMLRYMGLDGDFGNPSSVTHVYGKQAAKAVEAAREKIAAVVGASPEEIVFTSGATEANNLAILGGARFYQRKGRHVITMSTEHKAVLDSMKALEREGFTVTYLAPEANGLLNLDALFNALRNDTILVSIMQVNNEIGVIQDIQAIGDILKARGVLFHVDAAQSVGRLPIHLHQLPVDLMSFSAHKTYGPKGVGALYVRHRPRVRLAPLSFGGGHEGGLRSGTLPTHQIVGMGEAFLLAETLREREQAVIFKQRDRLWAGISVVPDIQLNGDLERRIAGNLNVTVANASGEDLLIALSTLAISSTSACASAIHAPSHVLRAIGLSAYDASRSIRLSLGRFTTEAEIDYAIELIQNKCVL